MNTDPRSLNYPSHDDRDSAANDTTSPAEGARQGATDKADRRTGTNDELKELDRAERRRK